MLLIDRSKSYYNKMHFDISIASTATNFCIMVWLDIIYNLHDSSNLLIK